MEFLNTIERTIAGWLKDVPHLPKVARSWMGENLWWIAAIFAVLAGFGALGLVVAFFANLANLGNPYVSYYVSTTFAAWEVVRVAVSLVFTVLGAVLLASAVNPLKEKQKKGWSLLLVTVLLGLVSTFVGAILTLSPLGLIGDLIFGTLWIAVGTYLLFEARTEFVHVERSKGAKKRKA